MPGEPLLKHTPADFVVRECLVVPSTRDAADATHHYLALHKCGYTTMEAARLIADRLGISGRDVTYGGLKDEDGITEQLVGVPYGVLEPADPKSAFDPALEVVESAQRWMQLRHHGFGRAPLRVGHLEGNGFAIVVRGLDEPTAAALSAMRKVVLHYLNYYDIQRFGVPGGPRRTHLVGAAILDGRWQDALAELRALRAPESPMAAAWDGDPREFFGTLDPRTTSFYLAAHSSADFNARLAGLVDTLIPDQARTVSVEGIDFRYATSPEAAVRVLADSGRLPYSRYTYEDGVPQKHESMRASVVQTTISISEYQPDTEIPGAYQLGLNFFLPSGSYATAAVRQLFALDLTRTATPVLEGQR